MIRLKQVMNDTSGIFAKLSTHNPPWGSEVQSALLDFMYLGNHSGDKIVSPIVAKNLADGQLTDEALTKLAAIIAAMYMPNWINIWDVLHLEYNPIENYDSNYTEDIKIGRTGELIRNTSDNTTSEGQSGGTKQTTSNDTSTSKLYGFNSVDGKNSDSDVLTSSGSEQLNSDVSNSTHSTGLDTTTHNDTDTHQIERHQHGNIGVTTSQQMIESELELRKYNFFEKVFNDIDSVMCLSIY